MKKSRVLSLVVAAMVIGGAVVIGIGAEEKDACSVRDVEEQVVLYTIHRGGFDNIGQVIGDLYARAGEKGIQPAESLSFVYLNNFEHVSTEHWLIEIRMAVDKSALKHAGTLGKMTDVKKVKPMKVAVATKEEGVGDPGPIHMKLYSWIAKKQLIVGDRPCERFLTNVTSGDYSSMKSEIMVPVYDVAEILQQL